MRFPIKPLVSESRCQEVVGLLREESADWRPGAETAGWAARSTKNNHQLNSQSQLYQTLTSELTDLLRANPLVQAAAFPRQIHGILFSRSCVGEGYGRHVDSAYMAGGRSDLSFTIALSGPDDYQGGELVLESPGGEEAFRLPAGHALVYPSTLLHRVEPVTSGERLVAVGWIESRIRHADQRELLFELDMAGRALFERSGTDKVFDSISRSYTNLLRRWEC
jgi:PKHD-type hydroxylase